MCDPIVALGSNKFYGPFTYALNKEIILIMIKMGS